MGIESTFACNTLNALDLAERAKSRFRTSLQPMIPGVSQTPTILRRCKPDETGVVISRYSRIRKLDWVAMPLLPYLCAVEKVEDVPEWVEKATVEKMRKEYAEAHLESLVSVTRGYDPKNVWPQLIGVAYIRKIYSFEIATTEEQDDRLIDEYNERENHSHFNLFTNNCADFSRHLLNFYYPHAVHRSITADIAITTPKQIAKSLSAYAHHHDQIELDEIIIPQIPGSFPRSHTPRGVVESLLKTKKYAIPIVVFHPYFLAGIAVTYLANGRFDLARNAHVVSILNQEDALVGGKINTPADTFVAEAQKATQQAVPKPSIFGDSAECSRPVTWDLPLRYSYVSSPVVHAIRNPVRYPSDNETWGSSSMFSSDCLDLPGLWNKKLGVLESPGSLFTCVAPLTIIPFTAEGRRRQRNVFRQWLEAWLF